MKARVNAALQRATGYQLTRASRRGVRPPQSGERLLRAPAFVLCTVRSGSTLLRMLLDSHSQIHAPHEMHLRDLEVHIRKDYAEKALREVRLDAAELRYVLWDFVLHRELQASGKALLVNKTPSDVFIAEEIRECWPDSRFIFLLRHPAQIARSRQALRPQDSPQRNVAKVLEYAEAIEAARARHDGLTVRYEDLAADPATQTRRLCDFLGVAWEPAMLEYGRFDHGALRAGLGDWKDKIRSGQVQPPAPPPAPEEIPGALRALSAAWGYVSS